MAGSGCLTGARSGPQRVARVAFGLAGTLWQLLLARSRQGLGGSLPWTVSGSTGKGHRSIH